MNSARSAERLPSAQFKEWFVIVVRRSRFRFLASTSLFELRRGHAAALALIAICGLGFAATARAAAQAATPAPPSIVGAWTLNKDLSDAQSTTPQRGDRSGRGGGGGAADAEVVAAVALAAAVVAAAVLAAAALAVAAVLAPAEILTTCAACATRCRRSWKPRTA